MRHRFVGKLTSLALDGDKTMFPWASISTCRRFQSCMSLAREWGRGDLSAYKGVWELDVQVANFQPRGNGCRFRSWLFFRNFFLHCGITINHLIQALPACGGEAGAHPLQ